MRPSDQVIETAKKIFGDNANVIVESFVLTLEDAKEMPLVETMTRNQGLTDALFAMYLSGIVETMSPGSYLNKNWKANVKK